MWWFYKTAVVTTGLFNQRNLSWSELSDFFLQFLNCCKTQHLDEINIVVFDVVGDKKLQDLIVNETFNKRKLNDMADYSFNGSW